jgi:hypothetical protein
MDKRETGKTISIIVTEVFREETEIWKVLCGGESGLEGYYYSEVRGRERKRRSQEVYLGACMD